MGRKKKKPIEYHDIVLTDIQIHALKPRKPISYQRAIEKSLRSKKLQRAHTDKIKVLDNGQIEVSFELPPEEQKKMEKAERTGKKIRIFMPKDGVLVYPSKDLIEHIKANKKNIQKFLTKRNKKI